MRGGQWQALRLHRGLTEAGHQSLLLSREGSPLLEAVREAGLPCDVLRPLRLGLLSREFDLVHAHDARSHTLAALFSRVPFVVSRRVSFAIPRSHVGNTGAPPFFSPYRVMLPSHSAKPVSKKSASKWFTMALQFHRSRPTETLS
jgi:hypothetical protein